MDLHFYIPALITFGAGIVGFIVGGFLLLLNFTDDTPSPLATFGLGWGIVMLYAGPIAAIVALGMQIAHWV